MDEATTAATFCATLVDEWARSGVTDAVVAPGSRSTPLTLALARDGRLRVHVQVDERAAGFFAVGLGLASGRPAVVVTTSGTAAVELHPAVVEADLAGVPLIATTTDRPPELHGIGAPQTVDQRGLFGRAVRATVEPGVPRAAAAWSWRSLAARTVLDATGTRPGPVHLGLAFAEPLLAAPATLPPARPDDAPWHQAPVPAPVPPGTDDLGLGGRRGVVVAGRGLRSGDAVVDWARVMGWPVLADPLSGCAARRDVAVTAADLLGRCEDWVDAHLPEAVVRVGAPPASKVLAGWLASVPRQAVVDPTGAFPDPARVASDLLRSLPASDGVAPAPAGWLEAWIAAEARVQAVLDAELADHLSEPAVARAVVQGLAAEQALVVASSMPVRDVEWFGGPTAARVLANRGANGIDGVVSTAVGVAATGAPTVALVGDLAFLHDTNALLGAAARDLSLTVVVVDNDGGGIFSFLPQADALPAEDFERYFGTPHGLDLVAVAAAHGVDAVEVADLAELRREVGVAAPGVRVRVVRTDRAANPGEHRKLHDAVAAALTPDA